MSARRCAACNAETETRPYGLCLPCRRDHAIAERKTQGLPATINGAACNAVGTLVAVAIKNKGRAVAP